MFFRLVQSPDAMSVSVCCHCISEQDLYHEPAERHPAAQHTRDESGGGGASLFYHATSTALSATRGILP